jgi:hypothetical protein
MTHTFFEKNDNFEIADARKVDQFTVEIAFADDTTQLELVFDPTEDYWDELIENLDNGFWRHLICRVQAKYDGKVMGEAFLGSIVTEDPEEWVKTEQDYVGDLIEEAVDQARNECYNMLEILKRDFLS